MTLKLKHAFVSGKTDGPDSTLMKPSDWNALHNLTSDQASVVIGRDASSSGSDQPLQELPLGIAADGTMTMLGPAFTPPSGGTAARPTTPVPGQIRYNTDTLALEVYGLGGTTVWTPIPIGGMLPSGFIAAFAGPTVPVGWYNCNGALYNRTTDAALFAAIGTVYGAGDGSTTFAVPNYVDRVLVGAGDVYGLGTIRGSFSNNYNAPLANHSHTVRIGWSNFGLGGSGGGNVIQSGGESDFGSDATGGSPAMTISTEQPGAGVYVCIKR